MSKPAEMPRLSSQSVALLQDNVIRPRYDRDQVKTGIVHIGPSAFFRGHLAVYIDDLLNAGNKDWGICAVSLKSSGVRDALKEQDYLYTVVEQTKSGDTARVVGSIKDVLVAQEDPQAVLSKMSSPDTKVVSLTVTQAGYYYKDGTLDFDHDDIRADLEKCDEPTSTVGFIVEALHRRMEAGTEPFTVMSCDNITGNGTLLRNVVLAYAERISPELHEWIATKVPFTCTMVDRIVPKTKHDNVLACQNDYGYEDAWPIYTEQFRQFVVERPPQGTPFPDLGSVGALMADDVMPYELMKIRLLNGAHLALGMIGRMAGHTYAHEAINDPAIRCYVTGLMNEVSGTLPVVPDVDLDQYKENIIGRLDSPFMMDELSRLARDGSKKIDSRFLAPLREALSRSLDMKHICFAAATWVAYLKKSGPAFDIYDTNAISCNLPQLARTHGKTAGIMSVIPDIFGYTLSSSHVFSTEFESALRNLSRNSGNIAEALDLIGKKDAPSASTAAPQPSPAP